MDLLQLFSVGVGALLGSLGQILVARLSKSRHERDAGVAKEYLTLASMTADELEKRINLVSKLDDDVRKLENENHLLKQKQISRDEQMMSLEARLSALQGQIDTDARERADLRTKLSEMDGRYRVLWRYVIALIEQLRLHNIVPVDPPDALKSDPEIMKLLGK